MNAWVGAGRSGGGAGGGAGEDLSFRSQEKQCMLENGDRDNPEKCKSEELRDIIKVTG